MPEREEDPVLRSARREAIVVFFIWLAAFLYSIPYCLTHGYNRKIESLTFVLGFPDWVFWGIVVPWAVCLVASFVFGSLFMRDEDLGEELDNADDNGLGGG